MNWIQISNIKYACNFKINDKSNIFTLTLQNQGVYANGKSWILRGNLSKEDEVLASYWISDDGYKTSIKEGYGNKLWVLKDILKDSIQVISKIVELYK